MTTHELAYELLKERDNFITVLINNREYYIEGIINCKTHANLDDSLLHKSLKCNELSGNLLR